MQRARNAGIIGKRSREAFKTSGHCPSHTMWRMPWKRRPFPWSGGREKQVSASLSASLFTSRQTCFKSAMKALHSNQEFRMSSVKSCKVCMTPGRNNASFHCSVYGPSMAASRVS